MLRRTISALAIALLLIGPITTARAITVSEFTAGPSSAAPAGIFSGMSLLLPGAGPWNNIAFNFFADAPGTVPSANGTLFLLSQEFLGNAGTLSGATPGFLAQSQGIVGGQWIFASSVVLQENTTYWFYSDSAVVTTGDDFQQVPGTQFYLGPNYAPVLGVTANYRLTGDVVSSGAPEPGALALLGIGLGVTGLIRRRRSA